MIIYVPENVDRVRFFEEENLITVTHDRPASGYAAIEKKSCACGTRNHIAIDGSVFYFSKENATIGYPIYALDERTTREEFTTIVAWLIAAQFNTFVSSIQPYTRKDKTVTTTLQRILTPAVGVLFRREAPLTCGCIPHRLTQEPIYFLHHLVVSHRGKGPTLESVVC